jgi:hypothetical protein
VVGCRPIGLVGRVQRFLCLVLIPIRCVSGLFLSVAKLEVPLPVKVHGIKTY